MAKASIIEKDNTWWMLLAGGLGTSFFLLFTDVGRDILDKLGIPFEGRRITLEDLLGQSPYQFYPYVPDYQSSVPSPFQEPDSVTNPSPYWLYDTPYQNIPGPIPYTHPAAAEELARGPIDSTPDRNPIGEWIDKIMGIFG